MVVPRAHFGLRARATHFRFPNRKRFGILWAWCRSKTVAAFHERRSFLTEGRRPPLQICLICGSMRKFGGFRSGEEFFYGEVRGEDVHVLAKPYWIEITPTGDMRKLNDLH